MDESIDYVYEHVIGVSPYDIFRHDGPRLTVAVITRHGFSFFTERITAALNFTRGMPLAEILLANAALVPLVSAIRYSPQLERKVSSYSFEAVLPNEIHYIHDEDTGIVGNNLIAFIPTALLNGDYMLQRAVASLNFVYGMDTCDIEAQARRD